MTNNNIFNYKELKDIALNIILDNLKTRSLSSIARQCHISRPTLYNLLKGNKTSVETLLNIILNIK